MKYSEEELQKQKNERLGYEGVTNKGSRFKIIQYLNATNVEIEFLGYYKGEEYIEYIGADNWRKSKVWTTWKYAKTGGIEDKFMPKIYGVGCIGKATSKDLEGNLKKSYDHWHSMIRRCYDPKALSRSPRYNNCEVCERWKCYEYFEQDYEEMVKENNFPEDIRLELDKDIITKNNKIYSKENCVLVDNRINVLFIKSNAIRGKLPIGVTIKPEHIFNPYYARICKIVNNKKKREYLGSFPTPEQAFEAYKLAKEQYIKEIADEYVTLGYITKESRLYKAMYNWVVEITD